MSWMKQLVLKLKESSKKTSKKSKDEEPVKESEPILTQEQQSVLDELEVESYDE